MEKNRVNIKVISKSSRNFVKSETIDSLKVYVTVAPEKGRANKSVLQLLAKFYKVNQSQIKIVKGLHSSTKVIVLQKER